jgi:hypothetical protein
MVHPPLAVTALRTDLIRPAFQQGWQSEDHGFSAYKAIGLYVLGGFFHLKYLCPTAFSQRYPIGCGAVIEITPS